MCEVTLYTFKAKIRKGFKQILFDSKLVTRVAGQYVRIHKMEMKGRLCSPLFIIDNYLRLI